MSKLHVEDFPFGEWRPHDTRHCPECGHFPVELRRYLKVLDKPFSLAGVQDKLLATEAWTVRCTACGFTAEAAPHPNRRAGNDDAPAQAAR